jgi:hypothetical protein
LHRQAGSLFNDSRVQNFLDNVDAQESIEDLNNFVNSDGEPLGDVFHRTFRGLAFVTHLTLLYAHFTTLFADRWAILVHEPRSFDLNWISHFVASKNSFEIFMRRRAIALWNSMSETESCGYSNEKILSAVGRRLVSSSKYRPLLRTWRTNVSSEVNAKKREYWPNSPT